jgi:hypothetical protein
MSYEYLFKEIQLLFPRQHFVNVIDVFINERKEKNKMLSYGGMTESEPYSVLRPNKKLFDYRKYRGSELVYEISNNLNDRYGIFAVSIQLYKMCRNRVSREIVRAFIKNYIAYTAVYFNANIESDLITVNNIKFPEKNEFYSVVFDPKRIIKEMRIRSKRQISYKNPCKIKDTIPKYDNFLRKDEFIDICNNNGLDILEPIFEEILSIDELSERKKAFKGISFFINKLKLPSNKSFLKSLNNLFEE